MSTHEKSKQKHPPKKSPASPSPTAGASDLFPSASVPKPLGEWSSAAQLFALTGFADADLRRLANPNNPSPSGAAWIPKPRGGRYETLPTLLGLIRHARHQAERTRTDHPTYTSMDEADRIGLIPIEFQKFASRQGIKFINTNRTIQSEPLRRELCDLARKIFSKGGPQLKDIHGLETWDKDTELAKKLREDRIKLEDEREIRRGTLVDREIVDETVYEKWLAPARVTLETGYKNLNRQLRTILQGDGTLDSKLAQIETAIFTTRDATLKKMSAQIPLK